MELNINSVNVRIGDYKSSDKGINCLIYEYDSRQYSRAANMLCRSQTTFILRNKRHWAVDMTSASILSLRAFR